MMSKRYTSQYKIEKARNSKEYKKILKDLDKKIEQNENTRNATLKKAITYYKNIKEKGELLTFQKSGI